MSDLSGAERHPNPVDLHVGARIRMRRKILGVSQERLAEDLGLNVFYGGHYATETFGVKALSEHLSKKFKLPWTFIDHPTGL